MVQPASFTLTAQEEKESLLPEKTVPYIMPPERSLEIETPWDLFLAEQILLSKKKC